MNAPARLPAAHGTCWPEAVRLGTFGYDDLQVVSGRSYGTIGRLVRVWEEAGAVAAVAVEGQRLRFRVERPDAFAPARADADLRPAPRGETVEGNMWTALRQMRTFGPRDVAAYAATERTAVSAEDARRYCQALLKVGYLKVVRKAVPGHREPVYRLIRNTGPQPPRLRRVAGVWDPNTRRFLTGGDAP
jgi:hypothetical protein